MPLAPGLTARQIRTSRLLTTFTRQATGSHSSLVLITVMSHPSASLNEPAALALPAGYYGIAPNLHGFGLAADAACECHRAASATGPTCTLALRGYRAQRKSTVHLMGSSMGGGVVMQYTMDDRSPHWPRFTLPAPVSPFGFGGTTDTASSTGLWRRRRLRRRCSQSWFRANALVRKGDKHAHRCQLAACRHEHLLLQAALPGSARTWKMAWSSPW